MATGERVMNEEQHREISRLCALLGIPKKPHNGAGPTVGTAGDEHLLTDVVLALLRDAEARIGSWGGWPPRTSN